MQNAVHGQTVLTPKAGSVLKGQPSKAQGVSTLLGLNTSGGLVGVESNARTFHLRIHKPRQNFSRIRLGHLFLAGSAKRPPPKTFQGPAPRPPLAEPTAIFLFFARRRLVAFRQDFLHALQEAPADSGAGGVGAGAGWDEEGGEGFLSRALAFGPRNVGVNVLAR